MILRHVASTFMKCTKIAIAPWNIIWPASVNVWFINFIATYIPLNAFNSVWFSTLLSAMMSIWMCCLRGLEIYLFIKNDKVFTSNNIHLKIYILPLWKAALKATPTKNITTCYSAMYSFSQFCVNTPCPSALKCAQKMSPALSMLPCNVD